MKQMKKTVSIVLTIIMVLAMAISAAAADSEKGTITVTNPTVGQTYTIYKILTLESYSKDKAYSYKATETWKAFINGADIKDVYVTVDGNGYVTWKDNADAAAFAKLAQKYAVDNNIANSGQKKAAEGEAVSFTDLELGYYLLDSDMGTLCSLTTTEPTAEVTEKNEEPTLIKEVKEDTDTTWGNVADADRGQTVDFRATITAKEGAQNYIMHDKMDTGLTFKKDSVTVTLKSGDIEKTVEANNNYAVVEGAQGCTFHVEFTQAFCDTLKDDDIIVVSYQATVEKDAFSKELGKNEAHLTYGDNNKFSTTPSEVIVNTWEVSIYKFFTKDNAAQPLAGATFKLCKDQAGTDVIKFDVKATTEDGRPLYRVLPDGTVTEITTDNTGKFVLRGLDSGIYYLFETQAPTGYNKLSGPVQIKIEVVNGDAVVSYGDGNTPADSELGVKIENKTGSLLPTTGGIGTAIFYIAGGILAAAAVVFLVTRKRMGAENKD